MVRDNVTFRITVDGKQAQAAFRQLESDVRKLGGTIDRVNGQTGQLSTGLQRTGSNAAASAVNFQTATQGMLNLSTAAVQTYTSISNLDRANNRAKQSVIAVARAEDLLNNKQERLNQLQKSGTASAGQLANMQREIATATADLTVKQEKMAIEQAAVNDIYMLFATNVANVVISSMQTVGVLLGHERLARLAAAGAIRIQRIATLDATRATITNMTTTKVATGAVVVYSKAHLGLAGSIRVAAAAMRSFMASNPILLAAMAASTAALIAYETNFLGLKDAVEDVIGVEDNFADSVEKARGEVDEMTKATDKLDSSTRKLPNSYDQAVANLNAYRIELQRATKDAESFAQMNEAVTSSIPKTLSDFRSPVGSGDKKKIRISPFASHAILALAVASTQPFIQKDELISAREIGGNFVRTEPAGSIGGMPFGVGKIFIGDKDVTDIARNVSINEVTSNNPMARQIINQTEKLSAIQNKFSRIGKGLSEGNFLIPEPAHVKAFDPAMGGKFLIDDNPQFTIEDSEFVRDVRSGKITDLDRDQRRRFKDLMEKFFNRNNNTDKDRSRDLMKLSNRDFIEQAMFIQIGEFANSVNRSEAIRIAVLEKTLQTETRDLSFMGGISASNAHVFNMANQTRNKTINQAIMENGQAFRLMSYENDVRSYADKQIRANGYGGGRIGTNFFGAGFFKSAGATAAYQVARGSIKVPSWVTEQQRRKDGFTNGIGVVYQNAINRFFGSGRTQTLGRTASRAARNLNLNSSYMDMAKTLGIFDDPNFAERLLQMDNNINASETDAVNKANNLYHTVNQASREYLSLQQRTLANVGIDIDLSNVRTFSHWQGFAGGKRHAIYDYYTPAEMAADMIADMGAQGLGLNISMDRGFLNNMALLAKYNTTNFNNTAILDASISRLNISRKQAFDIRLDYKRGDNELRDRLRWRQRLDGMSTGNVVI